MRKGFSLVELSVVLVVIALIFAVAIKGRALLESARIKKEIHKIGKLQAGFVGYNTKKGKFPPIDTTGVYDMNALVESGLLLLSDTYSSYGATGSNWAFIPCVSDNLSGVYWWSASSGQLSMNVCVSPSYDNNTAIVFACGYERISDDKNFTNGSGRLAGAALPAPIPTINVESCASSDSYVPYSVRIW